MKIKIGFFLVTMLAAAILVNAQPQRRTVEERVKTVHEKMDSAFKLEPAKLTKVDDLFKDYYTKADKAREELMSGGERPSREAMMEKMQPLMDARDKDLKAILTDDQFKKWKDEIEPTMMPRRGGGGGGGNR